MKRAPRQPDSHLNEALARELLARIDPSLTQLSAGELAELMNRAGASSPQDAPKGAARWQDDIIEQRVAEGATVLDLGCGGGELLERLIEHRHVRGQGVELDWSAVAECVVRAVPVVQANLDEGLKGFAQQSFDYVILEETLQTLHRPNDVLNDMLRVGRRGIVSFPNFACWVVRFDLALRGRMPVTPRLPSRWYDTANIHLLTLQDFLDWARDNSARIVEAHALADGAVRPLQEGDNLYAEEVLLVVEKQRA